MKPWEREVLEYRPKIGMTPTILSEVNGTKQSEAVFKPSAIAERSAQLLATNVADDLVVTLSRANNILNTLDRCLKHNDAYNAYRQAKDDGDDIEAERIHFDNVTNIDGVPQLDVLPLIEDLYEEMEKFADFVNNELFDGKGNFDDIDRMREEEEKAVNMIFTSEASGKSLNYERLAARLKTIMALTERNAYYQAVVDSVDEYLKLKAKDYVENDVEGLLYYLSNVKPEHLDAVKEALMVQFRENASHSVNMLKQMKRAGGADIRKAMDNNLSSVRKKYHDVYESLLPYTEDGTMDNSMGAQIFMMLVQEGADRIAQAFEGVVTDHISNSILNTSQCQSLFAFLKAKRKAQSLHELVTLFQDEFDPIDLDREIQRFIRQYKLTAPGTYCG